MAFSRVKSLNGLFIKNFNPNSIKVSPTLVCEMERLASESLLPPLPVPNVLTVFSSDVIKIGHLNVRSYLGKLANDSCISHTDVMCFTETFLKPCPHIASLPLSCSSSAQFRFDRDVSQDLSNGGVMIVCASHLMPHTVSLQHHRDLEIVSILVNHQQLCIVAVYRRPQLSLSRFLTLFKDYLYHLPHSTIPTIILGDFNENLLSSLLSSYMLSVGFSQLVTVPTTNQGSLLDHIYYNRSNADAVDVVDTYYSDHSACFVSLPSSVSLGHIESFEALHFLL